MNSADDAGQTRDALFAAVHADPALAELSPAALQDLCARSERRSFAQDTAILVQGAASDHALIIVSGEVRIVADSPHGPVVVAILRAPCLIGEIAALAGLARTATVEAQTDVMALQVDRAVLLDVARKSPGLALRVIGQLGERIRGFNQTVGLYTHALTALENGTLDPKLLDELRAPAPELREFGATFARFAEQIVLRRQRQDEMASAAIIQRALLPDPANVAAVTTADVAAAMVPARDVGGDFFDVIELDDGRLAIGIGDVCGKGMPAALFMGIAKTLLRVNIKSQPDLAAAVAQANASLAGDNTAELFATLFYAVFDPRSGHLDYCSCGHNPPFLRRANGDVSPLSAGGLPIGIMETAKFALRRETLAPGDLLFIYTDGITEAAAVSGEEFGEARLAQLLRDGGELSARRWIDHVHAAVETFASGAPQFDDITSLALIAIGAVGDRD
jgi:sigma-B regulation protein RsbU (phosphoserine phosphatase)